jgi:small subunit ribosomal protein S25e
LDRATYDKILTGIPKAGKHISTSLVIEKFKVVGSIARVLLKRAAENGSIRSVETHSKQTIYTPVAVVEKAVVEQVKEVAATGAKKEKAPKAKK